MERTATVPRMATAARAAKAIAYFIVDIKV